MNAVTRTLARTLILRRFARSAVAAGAVAAFVGLAAPAHADAPTTAHAAFAVPAAFTAPAAGVAPGCLPGYVWRDARDGDGVCVTPAERDRVHAQNANAANTHVPGGNGCLTGYVWRDAWDGDGVCVTPYERDQAHRQNAEAASHSLSAAPVPVGPSPRPLPKPVCTYDGTSTTGTRTGGNPTRYQALYSPALGAQWNKCTHTVTIYFNGDNTNTHFNLMVNGNQRELAGARGARQYSMPDSQFAEGASTFAIQSCQRGGVFAPSVCTNWSPTVKLLVHVGSVSQG